MFKKVWQSLMEAKYILVISHAHPDGDTIGATLGLYHALKESGKKVALYNATCEHLPREFSFLNGYLKITQIIPKDFDVAVSCDCGSFDRLTLPKGNYKLINIDHHKTNTYFGDINLVEPELASAGAVVYELLTKNSVKISKDCAQALYASIADDTGFFRYGNIDENTFLAIAELIKCGANPQLIARRVKSNESLAKIRLRAFMLTHFELDKDARIASIIIDQNTLGKTGAKRSNTKNIVSELRDLATVEVAIMVLEQVGYYKVSLRSKGNIDVSRVSLQYGGGGHSSAAGFDVKDTNPKKLLKEIIEKVSNL
jgi:phosphoesterase RecJ-like protein